MKSVVACVIVSVLLSGCVVGGVLVGGEDPSASLQSGTKEPVQKPAVYCEKTGEITKYCGKISAEQADRLYETLNKYREFSRF